MHLPALSSQEAAAPRPHLSRARLTGLSQHQTGATALAQGFTFAGTTPGGVGASWQLRPLPRADDDLVLEATYLSGSQSVYDPREGAEVQRRLWGIAAETSWLDDRLQLHAEYAQGGEQFDYGTDSSVSTDDAYSLSARYDGRQLNLGSRPLRWGLSVHSQAVERDFWSLAALAPDRGKAVDEAGLHFQWGGLDGRVLQHRRVDLAEAGIGVISDRTAFDVHYRPTASELLATPTGLFAKPVYGVSVSRETIEPRAQSMFTRHVRATSARARFQPADWWWEVSHTYSMLDHEVENRVDEWRNRMALMVNLPLTSRLRIRPVIEWTTVDLAGERSGSRRRCALESALTVVPGKIHSRFIFEARRESNAFTQGDSQWLRSQGEVSWVVVQPGSEHPSLTLSLRGVYQHSEIADNAYDRYQAYASITMQWPDG